MVIFFQVKQLQLAVGITSQDKSLFVGVGLRTVLHARKCVGSSWAFVGGFSEIYSLAHSEPRSVTFLDTVQHPFLS